MCSSCFQGPLSFRFRAPRIVREVDWVHSLWTKEETLKWEEANRLAQIELEKQTGGSSPSHNDVKVPGDTSRSASVLDRTTNERLSYPKASYYFLTGVAGCYTDFHLDFGGSSVWYHVIAGSTCYHTVLPAKGRK